MNTMPLVKNHGRFSFVIYLNSWALPLHIDRVWEYSQQWEDWEEDDNRWYDEEEQDIPF